MKAKYGDKYNFVAVTFENSFKVEQFLKKQNFDFTHIIKGSALTMDLGFNGFPVNLFLDKNGKVKAITGNVPLAGFNEEGIEYSDGRAFIEILEKLR
jgi:hypothetical protein